ncbi:farnesyl pyrophosphate synthase-like [Stomoxys calcitrans]|uniref:farnesyl pyrophosphate synthase-like n=1 Tax=Stomoxys calcitrans TaxID=35570 RepID=UPI0027E24C12|nr:farnesyl pyrophosphate synthase-like [Stomoxys calcitrans]
MDLTKKYNLGLMGNRMEQALDYNLRDIHHLGSKVLLPAYMDLMKSQDLSTANRKSINILGWCLELLLLAFDVSDDIMDNSITRFGRPCWYRLESIGLKGLNESFIFESLTYYLLHKHFRDFECYMDLVELFHEITLITACGQGVDVMAGQMSVESFTMDLYRSIAELKTSYMAIYFPIALAMTLVGNKNPQDFQTIKKISMDVGHLLQAQNDYFDFFGSPKATEKIGTDIEQNKCSWLAVQCMQRASKEQKRIMFECYGKNDPHMVQQVKDLYNTLQLRELYTAYEETAITTITAQVQQASGDIPKEAILHILEQIRQCSLF